MGGVGDPGQVAYFKKMYISEVTPVQRSGADSSHALRANLAPRTPGQVDPRDLTLQQKIKVQMGEQYPVPGTAPREKFHFVSRELHLPGFTTLQRILQRTADNREVA
jgi:hypothetical protein